MMPRAVTHRWLIPAGLALALGTLVSGCASDRSYTASPNSTNVVRRPIFGQGEEKQVYLGGYAGENYDFSGRRGR